MHYNMRNVALKIESVSFTLFLDIDWALVDQRCTEQKIIFLF
jgi:hypothetical protein